MPDPTTPPSDADDPAAAAEAAASAALRRATRSAKPARRPAGRSAPPPAGAGGRDPQPLSSAVDRLIEDQGWTHQASVAVLMADWAAIVGRDLAEHVQPVGFDDGVLVLQAESTAWATQVRLLLPRLHAAVDERVGTGVVRSIRIQGPQAPSWVAGPRRVAGRGPRDTYG
jgi:predicted nucleic acid-binding Zn ribbon protein